MGAQREGYGALDESERRRWLLGELTLPRLLRSPYLSYSAETKKELEIFNAAAEIQRRYGADALPIHYLHHHGGERHSGSRLAAQRGGSYASGTTSPGSL